MGQVRNILIRLTTIVATILLFIFISNMVVMARDYVAKDRLPNYTPDPTAEKIESVVKYK